MSKSKVDRRNAELIRDFEHGRVWYWIEVDGEPQPCTNLLRWAAFMDDFPGRTINSHELNSPKLGPCSLITLFLGMDYSNGTTKPPPLYGTALFLETPQGRKFHSEWWESSRAKAMAQHLRIKAQLEAGEELEF